MSLSIRKIEPEDNERVAFIIRTVMTTFQCVGEGYSISDPEVDDMYSAYSGKGSAFYVVCGHEAILGVGGIGPLKGGSDDTCELKKMYFLPELRGKGQGKALLEICLSRAKALKYKYCYLETVERMSAANGLYRKFGFELLDNQEGGTGHSGCDSYYKKAL